MPANTKNNGIKFDASMKKLEEIVEKMENADLPLEESIKLFEEGVKLSKSCQKALKIAEVKIQKLMKDGETLEDFATGEENSEHD